MSGGFPAAELEESVALVTRESWLFVGGAIAYLVYAVWVLTTGTILDTALPFGSTVIGTIAGTKVDLSTAVALVLWIVGPALIVVRLINDRLTNSHGNLELRYRFDHPSVLLALPGIVLLGCLVATEIAGRSQVLTALALVVAGHLFVRTIAYGYRVYTLSFPHMFSAFVFVVASALGSGALVHLTMIGRLDSRATELLAGSRIDIVVEFLLGASGFTPAQVLLGGILIPAGLSVLYLGPQLLVGFLVYLRAPIPDAAEHKRAGQRYPVMPPVTDRSEPTLETGDDTGESGTETTRPTTVTENEDTEDDSATRVFVADDTGSSPGGGHETTPAANPDEWLDDTDVFNETASSLEQCPACGVDLPDGPPSRFCPNCGTQLD